MKWFSSHRYAPIFEKDSESMTSAESMADASTSSKMAHAARILSYGTVCLLGLFACVDLVRMIVAARHTSSLEPEWASIQGSELQFRDHICYCGETRTASLAKGCVFDELAMMWLHPKCIDFELTKEFSRQGSGKDGAWSYYLDEAGHHALSLEEVTQLKDFFSPVFTTNGWHIVHCVYYWRKLFRLPLTGVIMEPDAQVEHHLIHCSEELLKQHLNLSAVGHSSVLAPPRGTIDLPGVELDDLVKGRYKPLHLGVPGKSMEVFAG